MLKRIFGKKELVDVILLTDVECRIKLATGGIKPLLGYDVDSVVGKSILDLITKESVERFKTFLDGLKQNKRKYLGVDLVSENGECVFVEFGTIFDGEEFLHIIRDMRLRKDLEKELIEKNLYLKSQLEEISAVKELMGVSTTNIEIDEYLNKIVSVLKRRLDFDYVLVLFFKEPGFKMSSNFGGVNNKEIQKIMNSGKGAIGAVLSSQQSMLFSDVSKISEFTSWLPGSCSELVVPLLRAGKITGLISVASKVKYKYKQTDLIALENVADQVGLLLENVTLVKKNESRLKNFQQIDKIMKEITKAFDKEELFKTIVEYLVDNTSADKASIFMIDGEDLVPEVHAGMVTKTGVVNLPINNSITGMAVRLNKVQHLVDVANSPLLFNKQFRKAEDINAVLCVPLRMSKQVIGCVNVYKKENVAFSDDEIFFVKSLANQVAIIISKSKMFKQIQEMNENLKRRIEHSTKEIVEEKNKFEAIIDSMTEGVIVFYDNLKEIRFNSSTEKLLGIDATSDTTQEVVSYLKTIGLLDLFKEARRSEKEMLTKEIVIVNNPYRRVLKANVGLLKNDASETIGTVCVLDDITKRKEIEELKSGFVSTVSHELRTPLTSIKGYSSLLLAGKIGDVSDKQKKCLEIIDEESDRLTNLIGDVLDLSKMESGKYTMNMKVSDVNSIIEGAMEPLEIIAKQSNVELKLDLGKVKDFKFDVEKIKQVIINLVNNAIKFNKDGGEVTVTTKEDKDHVRVAIKDTGRGVSEVELSKLFNPFYQVQSHMTRDRGGTGLGLTIVKKIISMHNGLIDVRSKLGEGSEFIFVLPKRIKKEKSLRDVTWEDVNCEIFDCDFSDRQTKCWEMPSNDGFKLDKCKNCKVFKNAFD